MQTLKPRLAITMGDPAGIGAEVLVKTLANKKVFNRALPFVIGSVDCIEAALKQARLNMPVIKCEQLSSLKETSDSIQVLEPVDFDIKKLVMGKVDEQCGHAAVGYFEAAIRFALAGEIAGVVTCPINKETVHAAGYHGDIGHQEILARMTSSGLTATMLMTTGLKVAHLSTHKSLIEAAKYVRQPVIVEKLHLTADHMRRWSGREPRLAVAALNPHGGEGGMLGREEIEQIRPAVEQAIREGLDVAGPFPADSIFYRAVAGEFDAVLALYHDQGHIAIKMHNFEASITATMGIPFIRTSVDHGTAFDIAGKNQANADGLGQAVDAAVDMLNGTLR